MLVAGIGNPDRGDDGCGPAVVGGSASRVPCGVRSHRTQRRHPRADRGMERFPLCHRRRCAAAISNPGPIHRLDLTNSPASDRFRARSSHAFGRRRKPSSWRAAWAVSRGALSLTLSRANNFTTGAPLSPAVADAVEGVAERIVVELSAMPGAERNAAMHETALVRDVVRRIEDVARATGARRVTGASLAGCAEPSFGRAFSRALRHRGAQDGSRRSDAGYRVVGGSRSPTRPARPAARASISTNRLAGYLRRGGPSISSRNLRRPRERRTEPSQRGRQGGSQWSRTARRPTQSTSPLTFAPRATSPDRA